MAGTDLYTHIRYMLYTTVPSMLITLIIFLILGFTSDTLVDVEKIKTVQDAVKDSFFISPVLLLVPVFLIIIIIKKMPPIPAMLLGSFAGGLFAVIFQPDIIVQVSGVTDNFAKASYQSVFQAIYGDLQIETGIPEINRLFKTGGMAGMLFTIWLILSAMVFGGAMEAGGMLRKITQSIINKVKTTGGLVTSTVGSCVFFNFTASDQYIAIVVPGRMFNQAYKDKDLKPEVLSRTLEDAGTVTSVLIPWNTGGATQSRVLGVATTDYLFYSFFNLISPLMSITVAYLNYKIRRISDDNQVVTGETPTS